MDYIEYTAHEMIVQCKYKTQQHPQITFNMSYCISKEVEEWI